MLSVAPNLPDIWGEGAIFAFSGLDGETHTASGFVATYARDPYGLLFHTPQRRLLDIALPGTGTPRIATGDVYAVQTPAGELIVTFSAWHTLIGAMPPGTSLRLRLEEGEEATQQGACWVSEDPAGRDALALAAQGDRWALAYGRSAEQACTRALAGLGADVEAAARERLAIYGRLPHLPAPAPDRLLKKCLSVIKVNTLSGEGSIAQAWSTPDRVPHRDMWLWDSVFHSLAMNRLLPQVSWQFLKSVLDTQNPDGMIPHQSSVNGRRSSITQPPLLAWGVWENYQALPDPEHLAYALPHLERYLEWDLAHRDSNANGLLEWFIEENERCRSGESGLDNSPRFDEALLLDAVDFSALAAHDMHYLSLIARELGLGERSAHWQARARAMAARVHSELWDEAAGFYVDRDMTGRLSPVRAVTGFFPLLLDDLPHGRVERLLQALTDPDLFATAFPLPSLAVSHPAWSTDMWRGATWVNTNYLVIRGLLKQGRAEAARRLAGSTLAMVGKYYERYGVLFEFFDAKDQVPPVACDRKGPHQEPYNTRRKMDSIRDYHWTAALTACLLLDLKG